MYSINFDGILSLPMIENNSLYKLAKEHAPQRFRNQMRFTMRSLVDVYAGFRGLNAKRPLPDFLIIGAQKAGTTSLFNWLIESEVAQSPIVKEVGYFDTRWHWPIKYRGYFDTKQPDRLVGEATPSYLAFPEIPERVSTVLGSNCKIIAVLRDPVGRAVSHYFHEHRLGFEKRDMYTAMTEEDSLMEEAFDEKTSASRREYIVTHCSYVYRSKYSERLAPWFKQFNRDDILIINGENMFSNPSETLDSVAEFLGVKVKNTTQYDARNTNSYVFEDSRVASFLEERLSAETSNYKKWIY